MSAINPLLEPMPGTEHQQIAGVQIDIAHAGAARVKRVIYPAGFHWSTHIKPVVGTDFCMHAHVGFLAHGQIHIEFPDGCRKEFAAPQAVVIEPGHDGWVVGNEPAVLIEFDFEGNTAAQVWTCPTVTLTRTQVRRPRNCERSAEEIASGWIPAGDVAFQLRDVVLLAGDDPLHQIADGQHAHDGYRRA